EGLLATWLRTCALAVGVPMKANPSIALAWRIAGPVETPRSSSWLCGGAWTGSGVLTTLVKKASPMLLWSSPRIDMTTRFRSSCDGSERFISATSAFAMSALPWAAAIAAWACPAWLTRRPGGRGDEVVGRALPRGPRPAERRRRRQPAKNEHGWGRQPCLVGVVVHQPLPGLERGEDHRRAQSEGDRRAEEHSDERQRGGEQDARMRRHERAGEGVLDVDRLRPQVGEGVVG